MKNKPSPTPWRSRLAQLNARGLQLFDKVVAGTVGTLMRIALSIPLTALGAIGALLLFDIFSFIFGHPFVMLVTLGSIIGGLIMLAVNFILPPVLFWNYLKFILRKLRSPDLFAWLQIHWVRWLMGCVSGSGLLYLLLFGPVFLSDIQASLLCICWLLLNVVLWQHMSWRRLVRAQIVGGILGISLAFIECANGCYYPAPDTATFAKATTAWVAEVRSSEQQQLRIRGLRRPPKPPGHRKTPSGMAIRQIPVLSTPAMNFGRMVTARVGHSFAKPGRPVRMAVADFKAARLTKQTSGANNPANPPSRGWTLTPRELKDHANRHGPRLGLTSQSAYEAGAKNFLDNPPKGTLTARRADGDIVRYNPKTDEYGVKTKDGLIRTYFKPDPTKNKRASNKDYFYESI